MKIFISSLIGGFQEFRAAAHSAIVALGHDPIVAEDFGAKTTSPQIACLQEVRSADLVVLILGPRYGSIQGSSGVSPTHEEYLEAQGRKPILIFVQEDVEPEERQSKFISEVSGWVDGNFRAGFRTADELRNRVTRAIHDYQLATAAGPLDIAALSAEAVGLLPKLQSNSNGSPSLFVSMAGGPSRRILRPAELESSAMAESIHQRALFVEPKLFSASKGVDVSMSGETLVLEQDRGSRIQLAENGALLLRLSLDRREKGQRSGFGGFAIIQEDVLRELSAALAFGDWLLEKIDSTQRITHVALATSIETSEYMGWRTQAEQDENPNSGTMRSGAGQQRPTSSTDRPRAALRFQAAEIAEDIMVRLRRQMKA